MVTNKEVIGCLELAWEKGLVLLCYTSSRRQRRPALSSLPLLLHVRVPGLPKRLLLFAAIIISIVVVIKAFTKLLKRLRVLGLQNFHSVSDGNGSQ